MKTLKLKLALLALAITLDGYASAQKLGYSGRFANADGSPVTGPVNVTVEILTGNVGSEAVRCMSFVNGLTLANGVFNVELDFATTCDSNSKTLAEVLKPAFTDATAEPAWIRLTTTSTSPAVVYGPNPIYATPIAIHALSAPDIADQSLEDTKLKGIASNCASGEMLQADGSGGFTCVAAPSGGGSGDITAVLQGTGILVTGGDTGDATVAHADTSSVADISNSNGNVLQSVTFDTYGHVQTATSIDLDARYDARYLQSVAAQSIQDTNMSGISANCASGQVLEANGSGGFSCATPSSSSGDITAVLQGSGVTVSGGDTGDATVAHADTSSVADISNSNGTVLQSVTFDTYGHVQTATSVDLDSRYMQSIGAQTIVDTNMSGITSNCSSGQVLQANGSGGFTCAAAGGGGSGDITSVNAGAGIDITSPLTGDPTVAHADTSSVSDISNSNGNVLQSITFDTYGHVQSATSLDLDARYDARYLQSIAAEAIDDLKLKGITANCTAGQMLESDGAGGFTCVAAPAGGGGGGGLPTTGGTMTGSIAMGGNNITGAGSLAGATVTATGNISSTGGNISASGSVSGATLSTTGNGTIGGTLTVTGAISTTNTITANGFLYTSDRRKKENIEDIHGKEALRLINALQGVHFDWIHNGQKDIGFIAQDVQAVIPELVHEVEKAEGNHLAVQYGNIVAIAVEAIKEQNRQIASDQKRIAELEKQNLEMQKKLDLILKKLEEK